MIGDELNHDRAICNSLKSQGSLICTVLQRKGGIIAIHYLDDDEAHIKAGKDEHGRSMARALDSEHGEARD